MSGYSQFLARKRLSDPSTGIVDPGPMPAVMKPHQRDITRWALRRGRSAVFAGTGLGKTLIELTWADHVARHTGKPVLIFAPLAVAAQHIREGQKFNVPARIVRTQADVLAGINVTNYAKMDHFDLETFGGVVLDECFARGTLVDTPFGRKHIEDLRIGDMIINASGVDRISDVHRREVPYAAMVQIGDARIVASPNHPFFTQRGWVGAQHLRSGDHALGAGAAMSLVRSGILSHKPRAIQSEVLREILFSEMADETARSVGTGTFGGSCREERAVAVGMAGIRRSQGIGRIAANNRSKPDKRPSSTTEDIHQIESDEAQTFRAWGKWSRDDNSSGIDDGCSWQGLGGGIQFVIGPTESRISNSLQNRLRIAAEENRDRGGWELSPCRDEKGGRQKEGGNVAFTRVDGVEILEQGDSRLDQFRDANGKLYFYDLGATRHPSYSVAGVLVHNSSIIKSHDGKTRARLIEECQSVPFRLAATATPAPNDFMELGNHAEFLGVMSFTEMLAMFFVHDGGETQKWRLKGHAESEFWRWMASWSVMLRKPSNLGYPDEGYDLPPLIQKQHTVAVDYAPSLDTGTLFPIEANTMQERIGARRSSVDVRVVRAAEIVATKPDKQWFLWCQLNTESDALVRAIPGAVEIRGSDTDEEKERKVLGFLDGTIRVVASKPSMTGYGLNLQRCSETVFVGLNDSFEQVYQAIRRFWRFGQTQPVTAHFIASELEGAVVSNLKRKEEDAERMAEAMVAHMADLNAAELHGMIRDKADYRPQRMALPTWMDQHGSVGSG